ncbi:hypothetical protein Barb6_00335 [Bacteroidales bacterium Barb6]|nr:hypothetical protein Barb6_00335 [Bacteroidales bacterium Barb6]
MEKSTDKLPFTVPKGYMESLTSRIMDSLPEKPRQTETPVRPIDRIRPWLYLAAVFTGLLLFFRVIADMTGTDNTPSPTDSLLVSLPEAQDTALYEDAYSEEEEYLDYLETEYATYILTEEWQFPE